MAQDSKRKPLFITLLLTVLLVSNAYASLIPIVNAAEPTTQDKTMDVLRNVVGINTESYTAVLHSQRDDQYLSLPQKEADIYLVSEQGGVRATCSFVNNMLRQIYLSDYEGKLAMKQPAIATVDMAKGFLQRYQNYAGSSFYGELASMLENIDVTRNMTKSAGSIKLEVLNSDNTILDYVWTYVDENGIVAKSKNVILSYDQGQLKVFLNNWPLYKVVGTPKISAEEATAIAIEASKNFSYQVTTDNGTVKTVTGFKIAPESLGCATLSYVNFPNQSLAREADPFTLYPSWYVPLGFDKFYPGCVTGVTVTIWADTGEVSSMDPMIIDDIPIDLAGDKISQIASTHGSNNLYGPIVITAMLSLAGISLASKKKPKLASSRKLFSLRLRGILSALILFSLTLIVTPTANASEAIPNSKSRIYASMHGQLTQEQQAANWACDQIRQAFESSGYSTSNHCGSQTTKSNVLNYAQSDEQYYDRVALFHFGHMGIYGFNGGYRDNNNVTISSSEIYDKTALGKHKFVFIWVCAQAMTPQWWSETQPGTPVAWTHRDNQPGRPYMNEDGYLNPDGYTHCYIGFEGFSPPIGNDTRTFQEQMTLAAKWFIKYFYDYALRGSRSVRDALNLASIDFFQQPYTSSIFRRGYNAWWPGSDEFPPGHPYRYARWAEGKMRVYGNGAIWIFQPKITLAANYGLSPTFYLDGVPCSVGDVHVWPTKFYTISVSDVPNYSFDHFSYDGNNWGRPCSTQLPHSGAFTAHYNWNPTYYTLSISTGQGGTTQSPYTPGNHQCLSCTYAHVVAEPAPGYVLNYWLLDGNNAGSNPSIYVYMNGPHTLQAVFTAAPSYKFVSSISGYDGPVYNPGGLVGWQNAGQFATIVGYGPYYYYGWISGALNAPAAGHIYIYGGGYGPLYVYVSSNGYNWNLVSTPYVTQGSPYWINCGTYLSQFSHILLTAEDPNEFSSIQLDSVKVEPPVYRTLTISSGSGGSTNPSPGAYQYAQGTPVAVTANPYGGYVLDYWLLDDQNAGSQNPITVTMNSDHTLQAYFREWQPPPPPVYHWLTINAYDDYSYPLSPNVYVDGVWRYGAPVTIQVTEGWHTVEVEDPYVYWQLVEFSDGYGNGASRPIYSDTTITAYYQFYY